MKASAVRLILFQIALYILLTSCQNMHQEEYKWIPTAGAAEEYPIKIIKGRFISNTGFSPHLPIPEFINAGWGNNGGVMVVGPEQKPVPDSLEVVWLSYAEKKFYSGKFVLPKEKIADHFKKGFQDQEMGGRQDYNYLTLGFAPGGGIALWISGGISQVEIAQFRAQEIHLTKDDLDPQDTYIFRPGAMQEAYDRNVPAAARERVLENGIQYDFIERYQMRYNWKFSINHEKVKINHILPYYFNAESEEIFDGALSNNFVKARGLPKQVYVEWFDKKNQKMSTDIVFDEYEIRSAFAEIPKNGNGELYFEVDPNEYTVKVSLKSGDKVTKLIKQTSKTFLVPQ